MFSIEMKTKPFFQTLFWGVFLRAFFIFCCCFLFIYFFHLEFAPLDLHLFITSGRALGAFRDVPCNDSAYLASSCAAQASPSGLAAAPAPPPPILRGLRTSAAKTQPSPTSQRLHRSHATAGYTLANLFNTLVQLFLCSPYKGCGGWVSTMRC